MKNIEIKDIRDDAKDKYYYAMGSNSPKEIATTRKYFIDLIDKIIHTKVLAQSEGAYETISMLDNFERALNIHGYNVANY